MELFYRPTGLEQRVSHWKRRKRGERRKEIEKREMNISMSNDNWGIFQRAAGHAVIEGLRLGSLRGTIS